MDFVSEWQDHVSDEQRDAGLQVLEAFELDHLYDREPLPLVQGSSVLSTTRQRRRPAPPVDARDPGTHTRDAGGQP